MNEQQQDQWLIDYGRRIAALEAQGGDNGRAFALLIRRIEALEAQIPTWGGEPMTRNMTRLDAQTAYHVKCINDLQDQIHSLVAQVAAMQSKGRPNCNPMSTECPRCHNVLGDCDHGGAPPKSKPSELDKFIALDTEATAPRKTLGMLARAVIEKNLDDRIEQRHFNEIAKAVAEAIIERHIEPMKIHRDSYLAEIIAAIRAEFE